MARQPVSMMTGVSETKSEQACAQRIIDMFQWVTRSPHMPEIPEVHEDFAPNDEYLLELYKQKRR